MILWNSEGYSNWPPLSEKTLQPYAYSYNNPVFFNDPTGMEGEAASNDSSESGGGENAGTGFEGFNDAGGKCPPNCPDGYTKVDSGKREASIEGVNITGKAKEGNNSSSLVNSIFTKTSTVATQTNIIPENYIAKLDATTSVTEGKSGFLNIDRKLTNNVSTGQSKISLDYQLKTSLGNGSLEVSHSSITFGGSISFLNRTIGASLNIADNVIDSDISINATQFIRKSTVQSKSGGVKPIGAIIMGAIIFQRFIPPLVSPLQMSTPVISPPKL